MNRFKYIAVGILSLVVFNISKAAELTPEQKRFRSAIQEFLKEEGFSPTIDEDDNSLNFKKEGTLFWISVSGSNPIYIEFHRVGLKCEDADRNLVLQSVNSANQKVRCAKAMLNESSVSFAVEMYCHSSEEFKYVFYKCLNELDNVKNEVFEYYNGTSSSDSTPTGSTSVRNKTSNLINKFFPIYGITLGETTISQVQAMGYTIEINDSGEKHSTVKDATFWDFKHKDDILDSVTFYEFDAVPESLRSLGINWSLSFNQMMTKFKDLGFDITITKRPTTEIWEERKTLGAEFKATSPDKKFEIRVDFGYGNKKGEGYTVDSPNTFFDMKFDID